VIPPNGLTVGLLTSQVSPWSIHVIDDDGTSGTDPICDLAPVLTSSAFNAGTATFTNVGSCPSLTLGLACASP